MTIFVPVVADYWHTRPKFGNFGQRGGGITSWYVRDAQGNVLAVYDNTHGTLNWREQHLYGSSRLGMWMPNVTLADSNAEMVWDTVGRKQYELTNHLGNVLATITDKRLQIISVGLKKTYFADVATAQDYYPFGMLQPGRQYNFGSDSAYRYGFNGKENDNSIMGLGNSQDYGERFYDTRIGKFKSVDPFAEKFPFYSSYQFAGDNPIKFIDLDGREPSTFGVDVFVEAYGSSNGNPHFVDYAKAVVTVTGNNIQGAADALATGVKNVVMYVPNLWKNTTQDVFTYQKEQATYMMHRGQEYDQIKQNGGNYDNVEAEHKIKQLSNGLKIGQDYVNWFGLGVAGVEVSAMGVVQMTIARQTTLDAIAGTLTNAEARQFYKQSLREIPNLLTKDASLEIQAKEASALRNEFRTEARKLMKERLRARHLNVEYPNQSWEQVVKKYSDQGYSGDDLYNEIIKASQKSNEGFDQSAGVK